MTTETVRLNALVRRRKRSKMSRSDCISALVDFARRVQRQGETSGGGMFSDFAPKGCLTVHFEVSGEFGSNDKVFEAVRVLGEHKLPRRE